MRSILRKEENNLRAIERENYLTMEKNKNILNQQQQEFFQAMMMNQYLQRQHEICFNQNINSFFP